MNPNHTDPPLPESDPYADIRLQIANPRRRLENGVSHICVGVLLLLPVLFAVAHIAADGAAWDFVTGERFSPAFHVVSSYAWRSPGSWAMVACMVGFAYVMGFVSWHAMKRGPGILGWFTAVMAAIAMVNLLEVAWYPFKPSKETFSQIQQEMNREPTKEVKKEMRRGGLSTGGMPRPGWVSSPKYLASLRSHWLHDHEIFGAQIMIMLTIMGARFLWEWREPGRNFWRSFWFWAHWVVLIFVAAGVLSRLILPDLNGLSQRVMYLGIYIWMLIIVREIELGRRDEIRATL